MKYSSLLSKIDEKVPHYKERAEGLMAAGGGQFVPSPLNELVGSDSQLTPLLAHYPGLIGQPRQGRWWLKSRSVKYYSSDAGVKVHTVNPLKCGGKV